MRLLARDAAGGISFTEDLPEAELRHYRYAILSHRWGPAKEEVTYEDIVSGTGKNKAGYEKIKFCIKQTRQDHLQYFWLDTCCIDKKNSAELSKSLISMFRWYQNAETCYVYLSDVSQIPHKPGQRSYTDGEREFRGSEWFRRGWTLQELIAPTIVEFFSKHGNSIGSKSSLEKEINEITRIPIPALRGRALTDFSIQERRLWQEGRETREPEDLVYSLLGLLEVSMPILYGEGRVKAWERLESAITVARKGIHHNDFSLAFSLAEAAVETEDFVGRGEELQEMRRHLTSDGSRKVVILHGLGGIGKTQLAMSYAKRYRVDYSALLWLNANDETSVRLSFAKMAKQILRDHPASPRLASVDVDQDLDAAIDAVKSWLSIPLNSRWLLICDNYDNPRVPGNTDTAALELRQYLPEAHQGCIIVTTRSSEVQLGHCIRINKLEALQDGLKILENSSRRRNLANDTDAIRVAKKLDGLPLALATAGAFLSQSTITLGEYLEYFERSWAKLQERSPALITYESRTLYSTWQVSFEQIKQRNSVSANLLRLWAYFDNQDLWFELLHHISNEHSEWMRQLAADKLNFQSCMQVLCDHGLAEANVGNEYEVDSRGYRVHACVHAWMLAVLNAEYDYDLARVTLKCVASHVPEQNELNCSLLQRRLLDHANRCVRSTPDMISNDPNLASVFNIFGNLYSDQGKMAEAEEMYIQALRGHEKALGADHTSTLDTVHNLGILYKYQGKMAEAEEMYMRALRGEKALGADHLSTLTTVNNLGNLYSDQGKMAEAEEMYMRALRGHEKALGADHPSTLTTVNNLGILYKYQGKMAETEEMYMRALRGREKALGADHTSTLDTVHNLGNLYTDQGKMAEAEEMYMRALRGCEKALGADHPSTLTTVICLSVLLTQQKRIDEANLLYCRARNAYDRMNPSLQGHMDRLGQLLSDATKKPANQSRPKWKAWFRRK